MSYVILNILLATLYQLLNIFNRRSKRFPAMAAGGLLLRREFGESAAEFRIDEDRVVAEAAGALRRNGYFTFASALEDLPDRLSRRRARQRDDAYKSGCPLLFRGVLHLFQQ